MMIQLPDWYDDLLQFESEAKGIILNFNVTINNRHYTFNFYDPVRFVQDANHEITNNGYFQDKNAVILEKVTKKNIIQYLSTL
ncbi:hypothetical protein [Gilliamella sp. Pas-s25]|uniref:hypothetical protein n=1 Tax=Gilliamella sp. Pas-s25 TaxID=2687310 RepID=UPI001F35B38D|nr:hypothetical protein [Gilliamella sp. Pas-s25]